MGGSEQSTAARAVAVAALGSGADQMLLLPGSLRFVHSLFIPLNLKYKSQSLQVHVLLFV